MRRQILAVLLVLAGPAGASHAGSAFHDPIYGVAKTSNIVYGTATVGFGNSTLDLKLDLYRPTVVAEPLPAASPGIVFIHGGAWISGDKTDDYAVEFANYFASLGYVVTSVNYRMLVHSIAETHGPADLVDLSFISASDLGFPLPQPETAYAINAGVEDAAQAMGWMRDNAATYNIDTGHIAIGGASAGAINSLLFAYDNPPAHVAPQAVVSLVGAMAGAESLVDAGEVPTFAINGALDPLVPPDHAQVMIDRMNLVGVYNEFYVQPGVGHDVNFDLVFDGQTLLQHNVEFLAQFLVPEPSSIMLLAMATVALLAVARRDSRRATRI